jgi:2-polyprenyl-6-hydroxyphenyl methylase/3-demethylubiquinone-9 3-methyltransferase
VACHGDLRRGPYVRLPTLSLHLCSHCGSLTALPRPTAAELASLHDGPEYYNHPYFRERRRRAERVEWRCRQAFFKLAGVGVSIDALRGARHLDIGCDTGEFLLAASRLFGTVPLGIDISARAVGEAEARGIEVYHGDMEGAPPLLNDFPLITAIDLIEHVADPASFLSAIAARLRPGGVCYLETPNIRSIVYGLGRTISRLTGGWPASLCERLFPPEHVQYLSAAGLQAMARACGLGLASLTTRRLPSADTAASLPVRAAMSGLQALDGILGRQILFCAVLRRPVQV